MKYYLVSALTAVGLFTCTAFVQAEEINIGLYGSAPIAMPYAVAMEQGFFKDVGLNITGIRNASGGNAARMMVAGDLLFADGSLGEVLGAAQNGADLKIVADTSHNTSGVVWVALKGSPIKSIKDLKGKRMSFTQPGGSIEAWEFWMLQKAGYSKSDVTLLAGGGIAPGLTLLEHGGTDVAVIDLTTLGSHPDKYQIVVNGNDGSIFPATNDTVGYINGRVGKERPDAVKAMIVAHRKAVEFMNAHRQEAANDIAKQFKMDPKLLKSLVDEFIDHGGIDGVPFFGLGNFYMDAMDKAVEMSQLNGALQPGVDVRKLIDESYLPDDLKSKK